MKKFILAALMITGAAHAADVTVLSTELPMTRGLISIDTKFYIDTDMKEGFAKVSVSEEEMFYVRDCSYGPGPGYPGPYPRGPHYPIPYCRDIPQMRYRTIMSDKVKIEGMTMNGDEVIYQGAEGDVVCGKMKLSRVFKVPTFYLSGKCDLDGTVTYENGVKKLKVTFRTK